MRGMLTLPSRRAELDLPFKSRLTLRKRRQHAAAEAVKNIQHAASELPLRLPLFLLRLPAMVCSRDWNLPEMFRPA